MLIKCESFQNHGFLCNRLFSGSKAISLRFVGKTKAEKLSRKPNVGQTWVLFVSHEMHFMLSFFMALLVAP